MRPDLSHRPSSLGQGCLQLRGLRPARFGPASRPAVLDQLSVCGFGIVLKEETVSVVRRDTGTRSNLRAQPFNPTYRGTL